jgi:hypothetical protein
MEATPLERMSAAFAQMLRDFGPTAHGDPTLVRSALTDLLGEGSVTLRAEIDAVALAAEVGIPDALGAYQASGFVPAIEADVLVQRITARGATPARAQLALQLWSSSVGTSVPVTDLGADATELPPVVAATEQPIGAAATELPAATSGSLSGWAPTSTSTPRQPVARRRPLVLLIAAVAAAIAVLGAVVLATSRGDDHVDTASGTPQQQREEPTDTIVAGGAGAAKGTTTSTTDPSTNTTGTTQPPSSDSSGSSGRRGSSGDATPSNPAPADPAPADPPPANPRPADPTPQPPAPPDTTPPPVAVDDYFDYTVQIGDDGSPYTATFILIRNDGGTHSSQWLTTKPTHGTVSYGQNSKWLYTPHHNGYFQDSFGYKIVDDATGRESYATVHITVRCNTAWQCYSG